MKIRYVGLHVYARSMYEYVLYNAIKVHVRMYGYVGVSVYMSVCIMLMFRKPFDH